MIKKTCDFCHKEFLVHEYRQTTAHFCSRVCYNNQRQKLAYPSKLCPQCGETFKISRKTRDYKYCGPECFLLGRRKYDYKDKTCPVCKHVFLFSPKNPHQVFCGRKCAAKDSAYSLNENFFDKIDSESKAYFLGLLFADGYVSHKEKYVNLTLNDREIIKVFTHLLETERPIYCYNDRSHSLTIRNERLHQSLVNLGMLPRKSWKELSLPSIGIWLLRHFLRGFYDGDGSFYLSKIQKGKYVYLCASLTCGSYNFLEQIKNLLESYLRITFNKIRFDDKGNGTGSYLLRLSRRNDIRIFTDYLYKDANYYLKRKYNVVKHFYEQQV